MTIRLFEKHPCPSCGTLLGRCATCLRPFRVHSARHVYCSAYCRVKGHRARQRFTSDYLSVIQTPWPTGKDRIAQSRRRQENTDHA